MKKLNKLLNQNLYRLKFDLKKNLTTIFLIVSIVKMSANTYAENTKISLDLLNVNVEKVLAPEQKL